MGLNTAMVQPGLRVRHAGLGWKGTVAVVAAGMVKVDPDQGAAARWCDPADFEPLDEPSALNPDLPTAEAIRRRYLTDPVFHQLVTYQRQLLKMATPADVRDALGVAEEIERQRIERDARRAAGDDMRGKDPGSDATEGRGTHGPGQSKP